MRRDRRGLPPEARRRGKAFPPPKKRKSEGRNLYDRQVFLCITIRLFHEDSVPNPGGDMLFLPKKILIFPSCPDFYTCVFVRTE